MSPTPDEVIAQEENEDDEVGTPKPGPYETEEEGEEKEPREEPKPQPIDYSSALPPELQGKSPEEVKSVFNTLMRTLEMQGEALRQRPETPTPKKVEQRPDENDAEFRERIKNKVFDDPEGAIMEVFERRLGSDRDSLVSSAERVAFIEARSQYKDFGKYEAHIRQIIQANGAMPTPENVNFAYLALKGNEAVQRESQESVREAKTERVRPNAKPQAKKLTFENDLQEQIFKNSGMTEEEYMKAMDNPDEFAEVPLD